MKHTEKNPFVIDIRYISDFKKYFLSDVIFEYNICSLFFGKLVKADTLKYPQLSSEDSRQDPSPILVH
jgi:hypothetical protein